MTTHTPGQFTSLAREEQQRLAQLSPFELKSHLIGFAQDRQTQSTFTMLNAGRGNPNWIATTPRDAFFLLGQFALTESRRVWTDRDLGGMPDQPGISARLAAYLDSRAAEPGAALLAATLEYGVAECGFDADEFVYELTDGIVGDQYPLPDRMLRHAEQVVRNYLLQEMVGPAGLPGRLDLFAVEGGTAAMCYLFDSLVSNQLLAPGDRIALMVPTFTPYLEIPELDRYHFDVVLLDASGRHQSGQRNWQYSSAELDKLADPSIKALFVVNPSNPPSVMLDAASLDRIASIVRTDNPNLIVITDDVYGTFVPQFRSLITALPENTVLVYSFSKYFGCTGWRLGVVALQADNVLDRRLRELDDDTRQRLAHRYSTITLNPDSLSFLDRMVADSRQVALNHTAGLSLPQQVQMTLFAAFALLDRDNAYKQLTQRIVQRRLHNMLEGLGVALTPDPLRAAYYVELDLLHWADGQYGPDVSRWIRDNYEPTDVVIRLAQQTGIVLMSGNGFGDQAWTVRVSLANLPDEAYTRIGQGLWNIGMQYLHEYTKSRWQSAREQETS